MNLDTGTANRCPHCGQRTANDSDAQVIQALRYEISALRQTVAQLRGTGSGRIARPLTSSDA